MRAFKVGLVGCGMIRNPYLRACEESKWLDLVACADLIQERAKEACKDYEDNGWGKPVACSYDEMLASGDIDLVMNITNPKAHFSLNLRALEAGKHVHAEKPLCVTRKEGRQLVAAAKANNVRLSCAPDTFLGTGHQTARALIDSGAIGEPTAVALFFCGGGPDGYHQDPEFFFEEGGGPMFDVGVYILTDTIHLLGPVKRVSGMTKKTWEERTILSEKKRGQKMPVLIPTHCTASLEFESGVLGTMVTSFDMKGGHHLPNIEVYGTEGTIRVPDPNQFGNKPLLMRTEERDKGWQEIDATHGYSGNSRGIGGADLSAAVQNDRPHRAGIDLAYHVLDVGLSVYDSANSGSTVEVESTPAQPQAMPDGVVEDIED